MTRTIRRLFVACLLVVAAACSGTGTQPTAPAPEPVLAVEAEQTVIPLSYLVRQAELKTAEVLGGWIACVAGISGNDLNQWSYDNWTRTNHQLDVKYQGRADKVISIVFGYNGFDPTLSEWVYGTPQLSPPVIDERPNHTYMFDNREGVTELSGTLTESVVLSQSRTDTTSNRWHLDIGAKEDVTIGGEKEPAGFEFEASEQWGISFDESTAKSEGENRTESEAINYSVLPGHATLATLATPRVRSRQEFHLNGVLDASVTFSNLRDELAVATAASRWDEISNAPGTTIIEHPDNNPGGINFSFTLDTFDDLVSLANGYNVDFPRVNSALCPDALDNLDTARTVVFNGVISRDYQTSSAYQFKDIPAGKVDEAIADNSIPTERVVSAA